MGACCSANRNAVSLEGTINMAPSQYITNDATFSEKLKIFEKIRTGEIE